MSKTGIYTAIKTKEKLDYPDHVLFLTYWEFPNIYIVYEAQYFASSWPWGQSCDFSDRSNFPLVFGTAKVRPQIVRRPRSYRANRWLWTVHRWSLTYYFSISLWLFPCIRSDSMDYSRKSFHMLWPGQIQTTQKCFWHGET